MSYLAFVVGLDLLNHPLDLFGSDPLLHILQCVNRDNPNHTVRHQPCRLQSHRATQGTSDEHDPLQTELGYYSLNVVAKTLNGPVSPSLARLAVAGQVDRNYLMIPSEDGDLVFPESLVTTPAGDENQRRVALPLNLAVNGNSVRSSHHRGQ